MMKQEAFFLNFKVTFQKSCAEAKRKASETFKRKTFKTGN